MKTQLLIVDDDADMVRLIKTGLKQAGYACEHRNDADSAYSLLKSRNFDLLLLDIELPGISGLKFLELLKQDANTASLPVIMLTVLDKESDKIRGLGTGADDYLPKPFSMKELCARVEALLRRVKYAGVPRKIIECGPIRLDLDKNEASIKGKRIVLTKAELDLLELLMRRKGSTLTYAALSDALSEGNRIVTSETLYAHVKNLRKKLGPAAKRLETSHGIGYRLNDE